MKFRYFFAVRVETDIEFMFKILPCMDCHKHSNKNEIADLFTFNLFVCSAPFLYPLKTSENLQVFWCFQGVEKGCIGNKWVNKEIFKGKLFYPREYTGLLKTFKTGSFITIVNGLKLLTIVAKLSKIFVGVLATLLLKNLFFLAVLKLDLKDSFGYKKESECMWKTFHINTPYHVVFL